MDKLTLKPNSVITLPSNLKSGDFFRLWVDLLKILHNLTDREIDVVVAFLRRRYELSANILDPVILDKHLMSRETKNEIKDECKMSDAHFQVVMAKLRDRKILINGNINPKFIPNIKKDSNTFNLLFNIQWKD